MASQQQQKSKTIPLKILVDKQRNKVVFVEATKDFVDTLFSFLSLPLATIVRVLTTINTNNDQQQQSESSPFLGNIKHLYQIVENITSNDIWSNPACKQMLMRPRNPCEPLCNELFLNIDDTEIFVCDSCYKYTTFQNLDCLCGKPLIRRAKNLDSEDLVSNAQNGAYVRESEPLFLVSDDLKILPNSVVNSLRMLLELGCSDLTQLEEVTLNVGKQEILNLLKDSLTSHEPLTNTILKSSSKNKENPTNPSAAAVRVMPRTSDCGKMEIKVVQSKSQKKIVIAEADGDFVDFILSFLTMPLGSIVKLLGGNSFSGCVGNLYESVKNLDPASVLLNPGIVLQFSCPNLPLNIPRVQPPSTRYYYNRYHCGTIGISKTPESFVDPCSLTLADPRSVNMSKERVVEFVKRATLYGIEDDLNVKPLAANSFHSYLQVLSLPLDDLEVKMISFGEAEALSFLGAFLTSKFTMTAGLQDILKVP